MSSRAPMRRRTTCSRSNSGKTGTLWFEHELLAADAENLLHPRGLLTDDERAVPFNFLGLPVAYGAAYAVVGEHVKFIAILLSVATVVFLWQAARELFGARVEDVLVAVVACTPLLYYFNRPYMNALPAVTFLSLGIWLLARDANVRRTPLFVGAAVACSLAMLFRYEYAVICVPLLAFAAVRRVPSVRSWEFLCTAAIPALIVGALFAVPVAVLNDYVYGSWSTYGYGLFNDAYYPATESVGGSLIERVASLPSRIFVPSDLNVATIGRNLIRFTFLQTPVLAVLAVAGLVLVFRDRRPRLDGDVLRAVGRGVHPVPRVERDVGGRRHVAEF